MVFLAPPIPGPGSPQLPTFWPIFWLVRVLPPVGGWGAAGLLSWSFWHARDRGLELDLPGNLANNFVISK